jgi:hypothetical protein
MISRAILSDLPLDSASGKRYLLVRSAMYLYTSCGDSG